MSFNYQFTLGLSAHPFRNGGNTAAFPIRSTNNIGIPFTFLVTSKVVPIFLKYSPNHVYIESGEVIIPRDYAFRDRKLNKQQITELFLYSPIILPVKFNTFKLLVGKGFIARILNDISLPDLTIDNIEILIFTQCVNETTPFSNSLSTTEQLSERIPNLEIIINRKLYSHDLRIIQSTIGPIIDTHDGETLITPNILNYFGTKLKIPIFKTLREKKSYTDALICNILSLIKQTA